MKSTALDGRVIVLIGGLGLIGQGLARGLAAAGATIVIASRKAGIDGALTVFRDLPDTVCARMAAYSVDITIPDSVQNLLEQVEARHGVIHGVVNCSYPQQDAFGTRFENVDPRVFQDNVARHLGGFFVVAQKSLALFSRQGFGGLVMFSSVYGVINPRFEIYNGTGMTKEIEYSVVKSGIIHMTKYLAKYYSGKGIRVNCISPGGVFNDQDPLFVGNYNKYCNGVGMMDPSDLAGATVFLLSEDSACITGQNLVVDDGFSL